MHILATRNVHQRKLDREIFLRKLDPLKISGYTCTVMKNKHVILTHGGVI